MGDGVADSELGEEAGVERLISNLLGWGHELEAAFSMTNQNKSAMNNDVRTTPDQDLLLVR